MESFGSRAFSLKTHFPLKTRSALLQYNLVKIKPLFKKYLHPQTLRKYQMRKAKCKNSSVYYSTPFLTRHLKPSWLLKIVVHVRPALPLPDLLTVKPEINDP